MAIRYAVASGNWSSTSTWDGGTLPASTDDVYANSKIIAIDQSITVNSLKATSNTSPAINPGGKFNVAVAVTINITAGNLGQDCGADNAYLLGLSAGAHAVTINSSLKGCATGIFRTGVSLNGGYSGTLTINGSISGGSGTDNAAFYVDWSSSAVTVTGAVTGGATYAIWLQDVITLHIIGDVSGASGTCISAESGNVTIDGNVSTSSGIAVNFQGTKLAINGNITGAPVSNTSAVRFAGTGLHADACTVRGNIYPGASAAAFSYALQNIGYGGQIRISGDIWSGGSTGASAGYQGLFPITGAWTVIAGETVNIHLVNDATYPHSSGSAGTVLASTTGGGSPRPTTGQLWPRGH